jgi:formiminotetrahydrofolate cyclodeaminase
MAQDSNRKLKDLSLAEFAGELAARTPTPGGGSMAAYLSACGAALASMAFRFTTGEKHASVESAMLARAAELDPLRARSLELVQLDTDAYDEVTAAYALSKSNEAERAERAAQIQAALKGALEVPFETMQTALAALRIAADGAADINRNLASDCAVGVACLAQAIEGAFLNVSINAGSIKDEDYVRSRLAQCDAIRAEARELAEAARLATQRELV